VAETFPIISSVFIGASLAIAYAAVASMILIGALIYATAKMRMGSLGVDITKVYDEIPPE
jgi:hypothetical protein